MRHAIEMQLSENFDAQSLVGTVISSVETMRRNAGQLRISNLIKY